MVVKRPLDFFKSLLLVFLVLLLFLQCLYGQWISTTTISHVLASTTTTKLSVRFSNSDSDTINCRICPVASNLFNPICADPAIGLITSTTTSNIPTTPVDLPFSLGGTTNNPSSTLQASTQYYVNCIE